MFCYSRVRDARKLYYKKYISPVLGHVSQPIVRQAIYRLFITHPMTDILTEAGLSPVSSPVQ